jgi:hypothetical protein
MGLSQMEVSDLDGDGWPEMLFTYSYGSGVSQSALGMVHGPPEETVVEPSGQIAFMQELELERQDDQTVRLYAVSDQPEKREFMGMLRLINQRLIVTPADGALADYRSAAFGVSFQYPADWAPAQPLSGTEQGEVRGEMLAGPDGFVELALVQVQSNSLERTCEIEVNRGGGGYGSQPLVSFVSAGAETACLIESGADSPRPSGVLIFPSSAGYARLAVSPDYLQLISATLSVDRQPGVPTQPPVKLDESTTLPMPEMQVRKLGVLTAEEYALLPASEDAPTHMEFRSRIPPEVFARRMDQRDRTAQQAVQENNALLAPFDCRLGLQKADDGSDRFDLSCGGEQVMADLRMVYPASVYRDEQGSGDFAMLIEDGDAKLWFARQAGVEAWDATLHRYTRPVLAEGGRLITVERGPDSGTVFDLVLVKADGETIFSYQPVASPVAEPVKGLWGWQGGWVLEVNGTLIVNGENINGKEGYGEIFNWTLIDGKPLFFFERGSQVGIAYDGSILPLAYAQVIHYQCCEPAMFNIGSSSDMVWFYALRDATWYYVELGKFE